MDGECISIILHFEVVCVGKPYFLVQTAVQDPSCPKTTRSIHAQRDKVYELPITKFVQGQFQSYSNLHVREHNNNIRSDSREKYGGNIFEKVYPNFHISRSCGL